MLLACWINNQACSLSPNIYVTTSLFITCNDLFEMIRKIIFTNYFSEFIKPLTGCSIQPNWSQSARKNGKSASAVY